MFSLLQHRSLTYHHQTLIDTDTLFQDNVRTLEQTNSIYLLPTIVIFVPYFKSLFKKIQHCTVLYRQFSLRVTHIFTAFFAFYFFMVL